MPVRTVYISVVRNSNGSTSVEQFKQYRKRDEDELNDLLNEGYDIIVTPIAKETTAGLTIIYQLWKPDGEIGHPHGS